MTDLLKELGRLTAIMKKSQPKTRTKAKKRPELSVGISKAASAREVADLIQSAWLTYGASDVETLEDGASVFTINGQEYETFDGAMKYLWFKTNKADPNTYTIRGLPYTVVASQVGGGIEVAVTEG